MKKIKFAVCLASALYGFDAYALLSPTLTLYESRAACTASCSLRYCMETGSGSVSYCPSEWTLTLDGLCTRRSVIERDDSLNRITMTIYGTCAPDTQITPSWQCVSTCSAGYTMCCPADSVTAQCL